MRSSLVWIAAGTCGLIAFGSTLIVRAPRVDPEPDPPPATNYRTVQTYGGPSFPPTSLPVLEQYVRERPGAPMALRWLARRRAWAGQEDAAQRAWQEAARCSTLALQDEGYRLHPSIEWQAPFVLAEACWELGEKDKARENYRAAIELFDKRMGARSAGNRDIISPFYKGWSARRLGDEQTARTCFALAQEIVSEDIDRQSDHHMLYILAASRAMLGFEGQAIDAVNTLIKRGWRDGASLAHAEEFDSIRSNATIQRQIAWLASEEARLERDPSSAGDPPRQAPARGP